MIKKLFYSIVIVILIFTTVGFFLPREVHVERSTVIDRPASTVFALVNSYATMNSWSPWAQRDPSVVFTVSGPPSGVGARVEWDGDPRLSGKGWQEIIESVPYSRVGIRLHFNQQGEAVSYYQIEDMGSTTAITWGFDSDLTEGQSLAGGLMARYFGLLFDRWIGDDYESGLANLKTLAESLPNADFSDLEVEILDVVPMDVLYIQSDSGQDPADIAATLASAFQEITSFMNANGMEMTAQPMTISRAWNESGYTFDAAIPTSPIDIPLTGKLKSGKSPGGLAVRVVHRGPYESMMPSYEKLSAYMTANGLHEGSVSWEQYISDPGQTASEDLVTHIYFQVEP